MAEAADTELLSGDEPWGPMEFRWEASAELDSYVSRLPRSKKSRDWGRILCADCAGVLRLDPAVVIGKPLALIVSCSKHGPISVVDPYEFGL